MPEPRDRPLLDRLFDLQHPAFRPLWRRVVITVLCLGWAAVEFASGSPFWGVLFGALGLYVGYVWFFDFHPRDPE